MDDVRQTGNRAWPRIQTAAELLQIPKEDPPFAKELVKEGPILVPMNHVIVDSPDSDRTARLQKIESALKALETPEPVVSVQSETKTKNTIVIELRWDQLAYFLVAVLFVYMAYQFHYMHERIILLEATVKARA